MIGLSTCHVYTDLREVTCLTHVDTQGQLISTSGYDQTMKRWDFGGSLKSEWKISGGFGCVVWPDGNRVALGPYDDIVQIFDLESGTVTAELKGHRDVRCLALNETGDRLLTGAGDKTARVWNPASGEVVITLDSQVSTVNNVLYSPHGDRIATSDDNTIRLWDPVSGSLLLVLDAGARVLTLAFSTDGARLIAGTKDGRIRIWEADRDNARAMWRAEPQRSRGPAVARQYMMRDSWPDEILELLRADGQLSREDLSIASEWIRLREPELTVKKAWRHARDASAGGAILRDCAERVYELRAAYPIVAAFWKAEGVLRYRLGNYSEAEKCLARAEELMPDLTLFREPEVLGFLAMAQARLGRTSEARGSMERMRYCIEHTHEGPENEALLTEVEALLLEYERQGHEAGATTFEENLLLRQQLRGKRLRLTDDQRRRLAVKKRPSRSQATRTGGREALLLLRRQRGSMKASYFRTGLM